MRLGETYARIAKASADKMEGLTAKAKHEAVSIHAITMLTLLFLPGTFVAVRNGLSFVYTTLAWILTGFQTFFSSGIIDFEYGEEQDRLGDWKIRWGALRLFGVVVGPLTGLVLTAWAITYFVSSRSRRRRDSDAARGNAV